MTLEKILDLAIEFPSAERRELIKRLVDTLMINDTGPNSRPHSIMELEGLGKDIWKGVDVQAYIDEMRDERDPRP